MLLIIDLNLHNFDLNLQYEEFNRHMKVIFRIINSCCKEENLLTNLFSSYISHIQIMINICEFLLKSEKKLMQLETTFSVYKIHELIGNKLKI